MFLLKFYVTGAILAFIVALILCRKEEKQGKEVQYGIVAGIALTSWIGLAGLAYSYRDDLKDFYNTHIKK